MSIDPSQPLLDKLYEIHNYSEGIEDVWTRSNQFNTKLTEIQSDINNNIEIYKNVYNKLVESHSKYIKQEVLIKNLNNLNVLMDSYISSIHVDESLSDVLNNGLIDREYLLKQAYLYAKIDLSKQMKHDKYPSLVEARISLNQLLEKSNKRIYNYLLNTLNEALKTGNFTLFREKKYLYEHLFNHSELSGELLKHYSEALRRRYLDRFDSIFTPFLGQKRLSTPLLKGKSKLIQYLSCIFLIKNREYLLEGLDIDLFKTYFYTDQIDLPESLFNDIITYLITVSDQEVKTASELFDVTDTNGVILFSAVNFPELKTFLTPLLEAFYDKITPFLAKSDDIIGYFIILTYLYNIMKHFDSTTYTAYNNIFSKIKLAIVLKIQTIISYIINHLITYNSECIENHANYLKSLSNNSLDESIRLVSVFAIVSIRANEVYNSEDIAKLLNDLIDTIINTIMSLSIVQANKAEEDFFCINHISILYEGLHLANQVADAKRIEAIYNQHCRKHVNTQMRLMFKPLVEVDDMNINNLKTVSNNFIASYKKILTNVEERAKKIFWCKRTQDLIILYANETVKELWDSFLSKIDTVRKTSPTNDIEELYNNSKKAII